MENSQKLIERYYDSFSKKDLHAFSPVDIGFPDDGLLAKGTLNGVENIVCDLNFKRIANVRKNGKVLNFADFKNLNQ